MLYHNFNGYEGFKEIFGLRAHGNGFSLRRNSILLAYYKSRSVLNYIRKHDAPYLYTISTMAELKEKCLLEMSSYFPTMRLKGRRWHSDDYRTDDREGRTADGDSKAIRYVRRDNGRVYKMKAGKMYRHLILSTEFGRALPEQVVLWLCEELTVEWAGHNSIDRYELHVEADGFEDIYSSSNCSGSFGSCMTDRGQHYFYEESVDALAAWLTDENDNIVARAVIFTHCYDRDGQRWRLCERQYSSDSSDLLKQILVTKLIDGGHIDGYKKVAADCHSPMAFLNIDGNPIPRPYFHIHCQLNPGDVLSYQDSFKWYNFSERRAYNFNVIGATHDLSTTDHYFDADQNWDEYHRTWTLNDTISVHYDGSWVSCDEDRLDDFVCIDGEYYHKDEVSSCDYCFDNYFDGEGVHSECTGEDYCCTRCRERAEREWCDDQEDYVWFNGEVVHIDALPVCKHCGRTTTGNSYHSYLTDEDYCCEHCREEAENAFLEEDTQTEEAKAN